MSAALSIQSLRKAYGSTVAVDDLSLEVEKGEIFGLIGPNGAGKTTAVECALGLRQPDSGTVRVLGMDPRQASRPAFYRRIGAQLQNAGLPNRLTVREAVDLFASFYPVTTDHDTLLGRWGLAGKCDAAFSDLSGGQKQRLFVALALVHDPDLVVLDEISTGLDPEARRGTRDLLREVQAMGTTVILVTHFMDEAQALCDRVALMHQGRCVALDTPGALVNGLGASYRVHFAAPPDFDPGPLRTVDGVQSVQETGGRVEVRGGDDLLTTVVRRLADQNATPNNLHAERATLEDVFLTFTRDDPSPSPRPLDRTAPAAKKSS
jgi:ABC-2 type transport system ATP-binding protein